jgi:hypothetical protein
MASHVQTFDSSIRTSDKDPAIVIVIDLGAVIDDIDLPESKTESTQFSPLGLSWTQAIEYFIPFRMIYTRHWGRNEAQNSVFRSLPSVPC